MRMQPCDTGRIPSGVASGRPFLRGIPWNPMPPLKRVMKRIVTDGSPSALVIEDFDFTRKVPRGVRPRAPDEIGMSFTSAPFWYT